MTTAATTTTSTSAGASTAPLGAGPDPVPGRTLQRVVLPLGGDADVLPLYVELGASPGLPTDGATVVEAPREQQPENIVDRRRLIVPAGIRASFATYFNAFPASYWRRWTVVEQVELVVRVQGAGTVTVYRSTATGSSERVTSSTAEPDDEGSRELRFRLPLNRFADGGWYWFDVLAGRTQAVLERAEWRAVELSGPADRLTEPPGTVSLGITTFNRPTYLLDLMRQFGSAPDTLAIIDEVLVVDQGTKKVRDQDDYDEATKALGDKLRIVEQANVGGSGGFARGMFEALQAGRSRYVLLIDDDVKAEPECILRGAAFADLCRQPTIIGGHMFNLVAPSHLHSFGEVVRPWRFHWGPANHVWEDHDFGASGLRGTPWMHRRIDVDYNAWWMCLIPLEVLKSVGLSLPLFIKWDDAEFGLRAGKAGYPTVSLPGMAVWHMPWTEKDDTLDWQAYFHLRNKLVAALLHSPFPRGGKVVRESMAHQAKHLIAMQYSAAHLRNKAIEDVLSGPEHLHATLATVLPEVRSIRAGYPDAQTSSEVSAFPMPRRRKPLRKDREPEPPRGLRGTAVAAAAGVVRQLRPLQPDAEQRPQDAVPAMDARWWRLAQLDSVVVSTADGASASWYRRDRASFTGLSRKSAELHQRLLAEWPALSQRYQDASAELVSPQTWSRTFAELEAATEQPARKGKR
jgi:galactofuranosylgalactofuranosylrhamnosyl-N-acetylglucosaminyl-diphospho-decaprenol beta-1,5/1,6-galactofuranosyltransferase